MCDFNHCAHDYMLNIYEFCVFVFYIGDEEFYAFFCDNAGSGTVADPTRSPTARPSDNPTYRPSESPSDRPTDSPVANTWWARRG